MDFRSIMLNVNPCFIYLATLWLVFFLFRSWKNQAVLASSQCQCCTTGRVHLSWVSKPNVWLFPWFFTYYTFVIVALICNLNLYNGLSPTLHQAYLTRSKLLWVLQLCLDSFICGLASSSCGYLGKFDLFLYVNVKML